MKRIGNFKNKKICFNNSFTMIGGQSGCKEVEESTYTVTGDGKDDMVIFYDDSGNELYWEIQDPY
jgi:hypothetical protein